MRYFIVNKQRKICTEIICLGEKNEFSDYNTYIN